MADATSSRGGTRNQPDDENTVLKGLRADCRNIGFKHVWEKAVIAEKRRVGYLEVLRFCWDYGLHPGIPNNGEDNFLLAHLFVGAAHSKVRLVPDQEGVPSLIKTTGDATCARLRCIIPDELVNNWLADHKLDSVTMKSEHAVLTPLMAELFVGSGKVSRAKVREFVQEFNIGLDRDLSPGELYMIVREIERSVREAGIGNVVTMQTCLRSVARACIFTDAVASCRLSYGEFTSLFGALSQLQPGLSPAWRRAALYGTTRQNLAVMSSVMEAFVAKIESVHPMLSKDAVRREAPLPSKDAVRREDDGVRRTTVGQELDAILRSAFDRYAALEGSGPGFLQTLNEGQEVSLGSANRRHDQRNVSASPTVPGIGAGGQTPSSASLLSSTRRVPARASPTTSLTGQPQPKFSEASPSVVPRQLCGVQVKRLFEGKPSGSSTEVAPPTLSVDGLLLFIGDTNVFPELSFESIAATAAEELAREKPVATAGGGPSLAKMVEGENGQIGDSVGLDADGFVRVCLQLLRDNFLAKAMGFYHRVEVLTDKQRAQEWEKRHLGSLELEELLQRLRAWMEHYRLPSRMSPFKRDIFAIGCPTESRPRTAVVARYAPVEGGDSSSGKIVKVDDVADRAVLNKIADVMIDLAVPATSPTTLASASAITGSVDAKEGDNPLEPDADVTPPLEKEISEETAPPVGKDHHEDGRTSVDRDTLNINGSGAARSVSASVADDSPEDGQPCRQANREPPSSSIDRREGLDEATSGRDSADEGEGVRNSATAPPSQKQGTLTGLAQTPEAGWQGQVTAREVAKRARAHQRHVSNKVVRLAKPAIRAESEGLLGRAWRGVAAKAGQAAERRRASTAFAALYKEQQSEEINDDESKQDEEKSSRQEEGGRQPTDDGSTPLPGDQDRRDKPDTTHESRDELSHDLGVTYPGGSATEGGGVEEPGTANDLKGHDETSSQRKAVGCFKRQVTLLKSLDRFSAPVPRLEPEVLEHLRRQLSIAAASNPGEGTSSLQRLPRKQAILRDALMGLGTMATLCGDDNGGRVLYERAAHCCRSFGDWFGLVNAYAGKARLQMATGSFGEAISGFRLALKVSSLG
eukprot:g2131.t1